MNYDKYCLLAVEGHGEADGFCICDLLEKARADERARVRSVLIERMHDLNSCGKTDHCGKYAKGILLGLTDIDDMEPTAARGEQS